MLFLLFVPVAGPAFADPLSPKATFEKYRAALLQAGKIEDLQSMFSKKVNEEINNTPAEVRPAMFDLVKTMEPHSVEVLSEEVTGDNATLALSGKTEPADSKFKEHTSGKVTLVKEDGVWKIVKESWDSKIEQGGDMPPPAK